MKISLRMFAFFFLLGVVTAQAAQPGPAVVVDSTSVIGSGFKRGHDVVIFGAANAPQPFYARLIDYLQVVTVDDSGAFRWQATEAISLRSIWFAVDLSSAEYAVAFPGTGNPPEASLATPIVRSTNDPQSDALSIDEYTVKVLLVRPNDAVWSGSPMRHGSSDLNRGKPGIMQLDLSRLRSVSGNKHLPGHLVPADFVIMIEPISLRFYAGQPSPH